MNLPAPNGRSILGPGTIRLIFLMATQTPPPRPPDGAKSMASICEPHRAFVEAQLRLKRKHPVPTTLAL